jgi:hypothetical protein
VTITTVTSGTKAWEVPFEELTEELERFRASADSDPHGILDGMFRNNANAAYLEGVLIARHKGVGEKLPFLGGSRVNLKPQEVDTFTHKFLTSHVLYVVRRIHWKDGDFALELHGHEGVTIPAYAFEAVRDALVAAMAAA